MDNENLQVLCSISITHNHSVTVLFIKQSFEDFDYISGSFDYRVTEESLMDRLGTNMHEACLQIDKECRSVETSIDLFCCSLLLLASLLCCSSMYAGIRLSQNVSITESLKSMIFLSHNSNYSCIIKYNMTGSLQFTVLQTKSSLFKMHTSLTRSYQITSCISLKELIIHTIIIKMSYPQLL